MRTRSSYPNLPPLPLQQGYRAARTSQQDRVGREASVMAQLECNLELLCLTGVEDKLQHNVKHTLELLRNAGIKVIRAALRG